MTSMIIEYDLRSPGRNYDELYKEIRSYDVWARITESTWFIKTGESCAQVRDKLLATLTGTAAWRDVLCESEYLKKNL